MRKKTKHNRLANRPLISFRPEKEIYGFLMSLSRKGELTEFINRSISFFIKTFVPGKRDPQEVLKDLKFRYPNDWIYVNRKYSEKNKFKRIRKSQTAIASQRR